MSATFYVLFFFRANSAYSLTVSASTIINCKCDNNYLNIGTNRLKRAYITKTMIVSANYKQYVFGRVLGLLFLISSVDL